MKTTTKILLIISVSILSIIALCIIPQHAIAQSASMEVMLSNYVKPVTQYIFDLFKQLSTGLIYLLAATTLLKVSLDQTPQMLDLNNSVFVKTGLNITTTLADILLIVVFIAIALGTVFNIESINAKKNLVKFFFAALLIHFAPLFVGMLLDISNIITTGLMVGSGDIFSSVFNVFAWDIAKSAATLFGIYLAGATSSAILGVNILAGLALVGGMFLLMLTTLPNILIQIMVMGTITGILFSYAMFFLTRVFMIQLLAVLAPLAILASVLQKTESHFRTWMSWLTGWTLGGIVMLFLLTLGLSSAKMIMPANIQYTPLTFSTYVVSTITDRHFYWLAIAIYMMAVEAICAGMIPALSGQISDKVSGSLGGVGGALGKGLSGNRKNPGFKQGLEQGIESKSKSFDYGVRQEIYSTRAPSEDLRSK